MQKPKQMTFEEALAALRSGKATSARRRDWHGAVSIVKVGTKIFVRLPDANPYAAPVAWKPYPHDFLATDWAVA